MNSMVIQLFNKKNKWFRTTESLFTTILVYIQIGNCQNLHNYLQYQFLSETIHFYVYQPITKFNSSTQKVHFNTSIFFKGPVFNTGVLYNV